MLKSSSFNASFFFIVAILTFIIIAMIVSVKTQKNLYPIQFETQVEQEIAHDFWQATLFIQYEDSQLTKANDQTKQVMNQAMTVLKEQKDIQIEDSRIQSFVRYNNDNQQNGWSVNGQIIIRTTNSEALGVVIEKLNGVMAIQSMNSGISNEKLASIEDDMVKEALIKFEEKAQKILSSVKAKKYRIKNLKITTPSERHARPYLLSRSATDSINIFNEQKTTVQASVDGEINIYY